MNMNRAWQQELEPGQRSPCGSGGGSDCLIVEPGSEPGYLIISDTDRTFRGKVLGHEVAAFASWIMAGGAGDEIMKIIREDTERHIADLTVEQAQAVCNAGLVG